MASPASSPTSPTALSVCKLPAPLILADRVQVAGEAQGSEDALSQFVQHLNQGPSAASVKSVEQSDMATKSGESGFNVQ